MPHLAHIALVVRDYDEAFAFYVGKLGFELVADSYQPAQNKRWVTIRPPGAPPNATTILLARASTEHQAKHIGNQTGGRVAFFLATDDFARDHNASPPPESKCVHPPPTSLAPGLQCVGAIRQPPAPGSVCGGERGSFIVSHDGGEQQPRD